MNQNLNYCFLALLSAFLLFSCAPSKRINKDFVYFQTGRDSLGLVQFDELRIQPGDLLAIQIFSKSLNQEQAKIFNIAGEKGYLVDGRGGIDLPLIGRQQVGALSRQQVQQLLEQKLQTYVKDPAVIVRLQEFRVNVLGEVGSPGIKAFATDQVTLLDAIGAAGDLQESGRRQDVLVIRQTPGGERKMYEVDLRSAGLFRSPAYQLQQNDVVYVNPTQQKLKTLRDKKDPLRGIQIAVSLISVVSTVVLLFTRN